MSRPPVPGEQPNVGAEWLDPPRLTFRFEPSQRASQILLHVLLICMYATIAALQVAMGLGVVALITVGTMVVWVAQLFVSARFGVTLTNEGITLHGWTDRHYLWPQVHAIVPGPWLAGQCVYVVLRDGRRKRALAPTHNGVLSDRGFLHKVAVMQQWHMRHAGHAVGQVVR